MALERDIPLKFFITCLAFVLLGGPGQARDFVTDWTLTADRLGHGGANWRTLAIMQQAMHDALNAVEPSFGRWFPPEPDEPRPDPALNTPLDQEVMGDAAVREAARRVLLLLHPDQAEEIERTYARVLGSTLDGAADTAGAAIGKAVGEAAVRRRVGDGFQTVRPFKSGEGPGRWQATPPGFPVGNTTGTRPFLFAVPDDGAAVPPPALDSPLFLSEMRDTYEIGGRASEKRTPAQTEAARYWYFQSPQRGFLHLALVLLDSRPQETRVTLRVMSQMTTALADSAILIWWEKERFVFWRPITAIQAGVPGFAADPNWAPLIDTPPHPEYPSGHASDCYVSAAILTAALPSMSRQVAYVAQPGRPPEPDAMGMGQQSLMADSGILARRVFPDLAAAAEDCASSRIWAGAHFRAADEEARRVAGLIAARALHSVLPL